MKALQLAAILLLVCAGSEALKCNRCVPSTPGGSCTTTVETCRRQEDVCASVFCATAARPFYFRRCMKRGDAMILQANRDCQVSTCATDRCN